MAYIKKVTEFEKDFLLDLVNKYKDILENKEFRLTEEKSIIWEKIAREFNEELACSKKTSAQLRKCWANMKARAKKSCLESLYRSTNNGKPPEMLRREYAKIMQMLPEHFADITDSIESEEVLTRLKAEVEMSANCFVPPEIQGVSGHVNDIENDASKLHQVALNVGNMHPSSQVNVPDRDQNITDWTSGVATNQLTQNVGCPNRDRDLVVIKTEDDEESIEMVAESSTSNSSSSSKPQISISNNSLVAPIIDRTQQTQLPTSDKQFAENGQNTNELDEIAHEIQIRLLEDKIRFQTEEHYKKIEFLNEQISHAAQEHQLKMHYLNLKLEKLKKKDVLK